MKEILTIQIGAKANYPSAYFWKMLYSYPQLASSFFHTSSHKTTPRLISLEARGNLSFPLPDEEDKVATW